MNISDFLEHVASHSHPEATWSSAVQAIWYAEKGEWTLAHDRCQEGDEKDGAWVHAHLHREEGDLSNARYWYHQAGQPESLVSVAEERHEMIRSLLTRRQL
ncbi:hypothetical protein P3T73_07510 [Kiritimatiellota bacterium B12222]|nr:hypothetical protein P3T73_07510 [Kiritimatiellota bacterium B12222]